MALAINDLHIIHSGGAANEDPLADLGGAISTAANKRIISQLTTTPVNVTGVTIDDAYGNTLGNGSLYWQVATTFLSWKPYTGTSYFGTTITGDGEYLIGSSAGYLNVTVVNASLPGGDQLDTIAVTGNDQNVFPTVSEGDSLLGITEYRCHYVLNTSSTDTAVDVTLWIASNTPAGDTIDIGLDPAGLNGTVATIADGETAPSPTVTFSAPGSYGAGLNMGNLAPGDYYGYWQRRTVPVETRDTVIANSATIALAATI